MRTTNRVLSALLGLALVVAGLTIAIEMAVVAAGEPPALVPRDRWYDWLRTLRLENAQFLAISAIMALLGLVLLVLEVRPRRPDRVQMSASAGRQLWISRKSVERRVNAAAGAAGLHRAHATVRGRPAHWRLQVRGLARVDRRDAVLATVQTELDRLGAPPDVPVTLALRRPSPGSQP
jgi:hypothetical protein